MKCRRIRSYIGLFVCVASGVWLTSADGAAADDAIGEAAPLTGLVTDADGKPVAGSLVELRIRNSAEPFESTTGSDGRFSFEVPSDRLRGATLVAWHDEDRHVGHHQLPWDASTQEAEPVKLTLKPARRITIKVTDDSGKPISEANTGVLASYQRWGPEFTDEEGRAVHVLPQDAMLQTVYALKAGTGVDYRTLHDPQKTRQGQPQDDVDLSKPLTFVLSEAISVDVKLVDGENGAPIPDTKVYPWLLQKPGEPDSLNLSYLTDDVARLTDADRQSLERALMSR